MPSHSGIFKRDIYNGKVAFVTGGGTGICNEIVRALMEHGANAVILGRRADVIKQAATALSHETGRECLGLSCDVRDPKGLAEAVRETVNKFGRIDMVICGAAGNFLSGIDGLSENAFSTVMAIDTQGTYNTLKATLAEVKKTKGSYIAISATLHYKGTMLQAHVSAAKAAIDALWRVAAVEYGPFGIRFNIIAPGPIAGTEGMDRLVGGNPSIVKTVTKAIPLGRYGKKSEIADAALFLFSPAASYITGGVLIVDGGDHHTTSLTAVVDYPGFLLEGNAQEARAKIAAKL